MSEEKKFELSKIEGLSNVPVTKELLRTGDFSETYSQLTALIDYLNGIKNVVDLGVREIVKDNYYENNESSVEAGDVRFTYVPPSTRESFDSKKLKEDDPELYARYVKVSNVKENMRISKIKKKEEKDAEKGENDTTANNVVIDF